MNRGRGREGTNKNNNNTHDEPKKCLKWNPDFSNQNGEAKLSGTIFSNKYTWLGESKLVAIIGRFEKFGVKLHCLIGEEKL